MKNIKLGQSMLSMLPILKRQLFFTQWLKPKHVEKVRTTGKKENEMRI